MSFLASWRSALRIARREARRSKGRSTLVVAMIAMPVLALAFAAATSDMLNLTGAEKADRTMGTSDARISWPTHQPTLQMPDPNDGSTIDPEAVEVQPGDEAPAAPERLFVPGTEEELLEELPGSTVLPLRRGVTRVETPDGVGQPDAVMVDASSPLSRGYVEVLDGRAPATATEAGLTKQAMAWLQAGIGDTVTVLHPDGSRVFTVVGEVEFPSLLDRVLLFAYEADEEAIGQYFEDRGSSWLVDTPQPLTWDRVVNLNEQGMIVSSRAVFEDPPADEDVPLIQRWQQEQVFVDADDLALGVIVAGLALLEVVLLAGPAFAVGARRRSRQLALVAANGGTPAHVRRIVLADGVVLGLLGAGAGIALGVAGAFMARPWIEELFAHARAGGYRVYPEALVAIAVLAMLTGMLAALVPAFVTARQSVIAALAGRRGTTRSRKRWIAVGIAMIGLGVSVTVAGTWSADTTVMLAGLVVGELGLVLCTPALVGLIARIGRLLPLAPRIALRDAARNRAAAAPAISAVMAAVAGSVALGMFLDSRAEHAQATHWQERPTGTVQVDFGYGGGGSADRETELAAIEQAIRSTLPVGDLHRVGAAICPPGIPADQGCQIEVALTDACPQLLALRTGQDLSDHERRAAAQNPACDPRGTYGGTMVYVVDGTAVAALTGASGDDLRRAQEVLAAGGVVVRSPLYIDDGEVTLAVSTPTEPDDRLASSADVDAAADADRPQEPTQGPGGVWVIPGYTLDLVTVPGYQLTTAIGPGPALLSAGALAATGLDSDTSTIVATTTRMPDQAEMERAGAALQPLEAFPSVESGFTDEVEPILLILLGAAVVITIGAASVGTALAAADGRADLSTLAAVGASPTVRRGLSVSQSGVIAGLGSLLGSLAGIGAALAVLAAIAQDYGDVLWPSDGPPMPVMPWSTLLVTLVATPLLAVLGAGLLTRSRLPIERRL